MQAKRLLSCGFAFLLVLAFAGVSLAQTDVADFEGTWVKIERPDDGEYVGIGDTLTVVVSTIRDLTGIPIRVDIFEIDGTDEGEDPDLLFADDTRSITTGAFTAGNLATLTDKHVSLTALTAADGTTEEPVTVTSNPTQATDQDDRVTMRKVGGDDAYTELKFHFTINSQAVGGAGVIEQDDLFARVTFTPTAIDDDGDSRRRVDNLNEDEQILPGSTRFSLQKVGDGKTFGIDNLRPVHGDAFKAVNLKKGDETLKTFRFKREVGGTELEGAIDPNSNDLTTDPADPEISTADLSTIKKGNLGDIVLNVSLDRSALLSANAASATILFVEEKLEHTTQPEGEDEVRDYVTGSESVVMDSAIQTIKFTDIYRTGPLTADVDLSEGEFGDSLRVRVFGFLTDAAGNLGGAPPSADEPVAMTGFWQTTDMTDGGDDPDTTNFYANMFLIDTTTPEITVAYPRADTIASYTYMSAKTEQDLKYRATRDGVSRNHDHDHLLRHLTLKVSESVDSIYVTHGDSTAGFQTTKTADTKDFGLELPVWKYKDGEGGIEKELVVKAKDQVGNIGDKKVGKIFYDGIDPEIQNLFPTAATAPEDAKGKPTIDSDTADPLFRLSEDLDSLSVRYVQKGQSPPHMVSVDLRPGNPLLKKETGLIEVAIQDTFMDGQEYYLQIVAVDRSGNAKVTDAELLKFNDDFENPVPDSFVVALPKDAKDTVVAGTEYQLDLSVLNKEMTNKEGDDVRAPTYRGNSRLRLEVSDEQVDRLEGVSFKGDFSIAPEDTGMGIATLDAIDWKAGSRSIKIISKKTLSDVDVIVEDLDDEGNVNFSTTRGPVNFDKAKFAQFRVQALTLDGDTTSNVIGDFQVSVTPTDKFDNPSMKRSDLIDSKIDTDDFVNPDGLYKNIAIEISSSNGQVTVPGGRQEVVAGENLFPASAANASGKATIRVYSEEAGGSQGSVDVSFGTEAPPTPPGAPAAPASLIVEDYMGPSGEGDQGGMVMVSFPNSADHATVDKYQIFRQMSVTTGLDSLGNLVALPEDSTMMAWVPWADLRLEDPNGDLQRAVIPALDNVKTKWAVAAVGVGGSSDATPSVEKRVFTKESVQQTLELLGMAPEAVLTNDELMNQFNAPEDYVKSILGDQKNLVFAPVNPDVSVLLGNGSVPSNIRTSGHPKLASERTATEEAVGAVDNIPPAAATEGAGALSSDGEAAQVALSWTVSADDGKIVDTIPYRGYSVPIYGVKGYNVLRGTAADALASIGTVDVGSTEFVDMNLPEGVRAIMYRIDAFDDNNQTPGQLITVQNVAVRAKFVDADGEPVYLMVLPPAGDLEVNFEDFIAFVAAFGSQKGDENYNVQADVNDDGMVNFSDFVTAVGSFGRTASVPASSKLAVVPQRPGVNADTEMRLELTSEKVLVGETISVTVLMANARALNGYGLELVYDADKFEFVSAVPAEKDLLKSEGGETPLFKNWPEEGRVSVANAIVNAGVNAGSVSGEGALVTFTFKVLREFEDSARFEIAQGVVFDPERLSNPVVMLGALDVQSTPTEFALHQNYPNPFNPQTNIPYDLAEGGDVVLRIYNLLGQEVRTLVRERQAPGRYTVQWSGMDDRGVSVSSGIYFYQVSVAGKFQDAKRLMLLK